MLILYQIFPTNIKLIAWEILKRITYEKLRVKSESESLSEAQSDENRTKGIGSRVTDATCDSDAYDI